MKFLVSETEFSILETNILIANIQIKAILFSISVQLRELRPRSRTRPRPPRRERRGATTGTKVTQKGQKGEMTHETPLRKPKTSFNQITSGFDTSAPPSASLPPPSPITKSPWPNPSSLPPPPSMPPSSSSQSAAAAAAATQQEDEADKRSRRERRQQKRLQRQEERD